MSTGSGVLIVLLILPGGLASGLYQLRDAALRRFAVSRGIEVPGITPDSSDLASDEAPT
jgi:hypothetical protein